MVADRRLLAAQRQQVEHPQVYKERIVGLSGKHLDAAGCVVECLTFQRRIVLGRLLADVGRGGGLVGDQHRHGTIGRGLGHGVELLAIPVGVANAADRAGVVEERVWIAYLHLAR